MLFEHRKSPSARFRSFPQNPIAVLAHQSETVEDDRLPGGKDRDRTLGVQLLGQVEVDVPHRTDALKGAGRFWDRPE